VLGVVIALAAAQRHEDQDHQPQSGREVDGRGATRVSGPSGCPVIEIIPDSAWISESYPGSRRPEGAVAKRRTPNAETVA